MSITKADLGEALFSQVGLNKREAKDFVEIFFEKMRCSLEQGAAIKLSGFGNFTLRDKPARPGRNPRTGAASAVAARRVVAFKVSPKLKQIIMKNSRAIAQQMHDKKGKTKGDTKGPTKRDAHD